jgi:hypothetical protein
MLATSVARNWLPLSAELLLSLPNGGFRIRVDALHISFRTMTLDLRDTAVDKLATAPLNLIAN